MKLNFKQRINLLCFRQLKVKTLIELVELEIAACKKRLRTVTGERRKTFRTK